jgi:hypothetical protein
MQWLLICRQFDTPYQLAVSFSVTLLEIICCEVKETEEEPTVEYIEALSPHSPRGTELNYD